MSEKAIRNIVYVIKGGLFVLPFLSLVVVDFLFFPFITGKSFFFRMIVEVLFFLWVFVMVFDKNYRPKKSSILIILSVLLFILTLATIFGENPYRSFWSNYERMEGLIGHLHLLAYFFILTSIFKSKRDWRIFFAVMVVVSFFVAIYGLLQFTGVVSIHQGDIRLDATFGNATYLAIFLVFHVFLISLFFHWYKNKWLRLSLVVVFFLELLIMFLTATRGAILGFIGGLFLFGLLFAIFSKQKKLRRIFVGLILFLVLGVSLFWFLRDTSFVRNNYVLTRFSDISFSERTVESRFTIWGMSFEGFKEHPVLGWGPENYNLVFNEYYESKLWKQEPWFDRSHNVMFDWLITAGVLGFLVYMGVFISALYMLWKGYKEKKFSLFEAVGITSLFAAYCFHNLFVFDNLTSYFAFFSILGYIHFKSVPEKTEPRDSKEIGVASYFAVTSAFLLMVFSLYIVNIKPLIACNDLLGSLYFMRTSSTNTDVVLSKFNDVFDLNTFGTGEAREQLVGYANRLSSVQGVSEEDKARVNKKAVEEMEKHVEANPDDIRYLVMLSAVYIRSGQIQNAKEIADRTILLSPNKQQLYFVKTDIHLALGQNEEAVKTMETAYNLETSNSNVSQVLAVVYILANKEKEAEELLMKHFSKPVIADERLSSAYFRVGNYERVKDVWLEFVKQEPSHIQYRFNLAATYIELGQREKAIEQLQKAIEINPQSKEQAEALIEQIRSGKL